MAFINLVLAGAEVTHNCPFPAIGPLGEMIGIGTIWECDICRKQYRLDWAASQVRGDTHWYEYFRPERP